MSPRRGGTSDNGGISLLHSATDSAILRHPDNPQVRTQRTKETLRAAIGVAHFTFDESTKMVGVSAAYARLWSAIILAHIRGPALPDVSAGIVFGLSITNPLTQCVAPFSKHQRAVF